MEDTPPSEEENRPTLEEAKKPHTPENELHKFNAPIDNTHKHKCNSFKINKQVLLLFLDADLS